MILTLMLSEGDEKLLLNIARNVITSHVKKKPPVKPQEYPEALNDKRGVFCTITKRGKLRGCIGLPYPIKSVIDALIDAAQSACEDPRFPPLTLKELKSIKIEISVLTEPQLITPITDDANLTLAAVPQRISVGRDGLIIQFGPYSGLLLPQVAREEGWNEEDFLGQLCLKAGLTEDMWKDPRAKIYSFQAQIFREK
jgi:uncharacterized protein